MDIFNIALGVIGLILSVVGTVMTIRARAYKELTFFVSKHELIEDSISQIAGLKVLFEDKPIEVLNSTSIDMKNTGNERILMADFAPKEPLKFSTTGKFLFDWEPSSFIKKSVSKNNIVLTDVPAKETVDINVEFDFLEPGATASFSLLHTGDVDVAGSLQIGKIVKKGSLPNQEPRSLEADNAFDERRTKRMEREKLRLQNMALMTGTMFLIFAIFAMLFLIMNFMRSSLY